MRHRFRFADGFAQSLKIALEAQTYRITQFDSKENIDRVIKCKSRKNFEVEFVFVFMNVISFDFSHKLLRIFLKHSCD